MSSPSEKSVIVSLPAAAEDAYEDSASSTRRMGPPLDVTVQFVSAAPNVAYQHRLRDVRARSASPRPHRTISPIGLSMAQQRARTAEQKADSAFSGVGVVADQTRRAQAVAEAAIAEARSVRDEVSSKLAEVVKRADVSASSVAENLTGTMEQVAAYSDAQTSRSVENLQSKTREYVEGHHRDLEAKIDQNQVETRRVANETQAVVDKLSAQLAQLSTQLNEFKPASSADVAIGQNQLSQDVNVRLQDQAQRIDTVIDSVQKIERDSVDNTKLLHDLMVSMENLGESLKQLKSEVKA